MGHWGECRIRSRTFRRRRARRTRRGGCRVRRGSPRCPTKPSRSVLNPVAAMITSGATDVPSARITRSDSTASHGGDDLDAPGPHGVDELVGQRGDAASLFHRRLQPERGSMEAVGRQVSPPSGGEVPDQRVNLARRNPGEQFEEDIRRNRSHGAAYQVRRCADRKPDPACAVIGELYGDVGGRIAGADHQDVAAPVTAMRCGSRRSEPARR